MKDPRSLLIVVLAAGLAFFAGRSFPGEEAAGQNAPGGTADSNGRMVAVTGSIGSGVSVLWLVDTVDRQLAVYHCKGGKSIELVAARQIEWDLRIKQYHDESTYSPDRLKAELFKAGGGRAVEDEGTPDPGSGPSKEGREAKSAEER